MVDTIKESSPANIALIKYMGKKDHQKNVPSNASLSWTIDRMRTFIEVAPSSAGEDQWQPLASEYKLELQKSSQERFLNFWRHLKKELNINGHFVLCSGNNFPFGCGLASSASSFSALTKAAYRVSLAQGGGELTSEELARLSSQGSGSSCRSLFPGWVEWDHPSVQQISLPYENLIHKVVVVQASEKEISSSQAHKMISSSLLNEGRSIRAEKRLAQLKSSLLDKKWDEACEICWSEFWDMHSLFETSQPSFGYMTSQTLQVLNILRQAKEECGDGPLVTMDAGPNVHLLFREDQQELAKQWVDNKLTDFRVL